MTYREFLEKTEDVRVEEVTGQVERLTIGTPILIAKVRPGKFSVEDRSVVVASYGLAISRWKYETFTEVCALALTGGGYAKLESLVNSDETLRVFIAKPLPEGDERTENIFRW